MIITRPVTVLSPLDKLLRAARDRGLNAPVRRNEPMAPHTSLRVGGPADLFVQALTLEHLMGWVTLARDYDMQPLILGRGSNILVSDHGIRGIVIENNCGAYDLRVHGNNGGQSATLYAESGASLPGLAYRTARQGWAGLEWAIGIPASVGAAVVNNAGAHDGDTAGALIQATILGERGAVYRVTPDTLDFAYRRSRLKGTCCREVVLSAEFALQRDDPRALALRMARYTEHRRQTQPAEPSVGSIFMNPPDDYAGRLIEACGLKGTQIGGALISPVHANWIINTNGASASDIMSLIDLMREGVYKRFGIKLQLEIELFGGWMQT
ncbi:MAG: UDP-N-acetylmuramate dehydrogenase [Anaerolineae bacterium]